MRPRLVTFVAAATLLLSPLTVHAQDDPRVGLTMGYPSAVGVLWQMNHLVALRPEFTWARTSSDSPSTTDPLGNPVTGSSSNNWTTGVGLSALFYIRRYDNLRTYVSPRFTYSRTSSSTEIT